MSQTSEMRQTRLTSQMDEKPIKQVNQIKLVNISQFWTIETFVQRGLSVKAHQGYLGKFSWVFELGSPSLVCILGAPIGLILTPRPKKKIHQKTRENHVLNFQTTLAAALFELLN